MYEIEKCRRLVKRTHQGVDKQSLKWKFDRSLQLKSHPIRFTVNTRTGILLYDVPSAISFKRSENCDGELRKSVLFHLIFYCVTSDITFDAKLFNGITQDPNIPSYILSTAQKPIRNFLRDISF